jgi:hypothetical protein
MRMDDEKVAYKGYEKMVKAGIKNVCVHKGLFAPGLEKQSRTCAVLPMWPTWVRRRRTGRNSTSSSMAEARKKINDEAGTLKPESCKGCEAGVELVEPSRLSRRVNIMWQNTRCVSVAIPGEVVRTADTVVQGITPNADLLLRRLDTSGN